MNDFDGLLTTDFGFKPQGKAAPMAASKPQSSSLNFDLGSRSTRSFNDSVNAASFDDLFGAHAKSDSSFNLDSMFRASSDFASKSVNLPVNDKPVFDKPVYDDDDIFDGVPGLKSSSSKVSYDSVFAAGGSNAAFDDLLGGFGKSKKSEEEKGVADFDDLIPGFGSSKPSADRTTPDIDLSSEPTVSASKSASSATEDPFKVFESTSAPVDSSSGYLTDPLEEISKFTSSRSPKNESSSNSNGGVYDDIDPFGGLGNSVPAFSAERNSSKRSNSPTPRSNASSSWSRDKESNDKASVRSPERRTQSKIPVDRDQGFHQAAFDMPTYSSDSYKPVGQRSTSPLYDNDGFKQANSQADMSPKYEEKFESNDDIWLTVSEIPLFTQPTAAPPPSRPPPPRPVHIPKSGTVLPASANARMKANEYSFSSSTQFSQGPNSAPAAAKFSSSQFDELEDFAMGRSRGNDDERGNVLSDEELEMNSAAAAMKEAMDRAEAKFRHAKEVRERENTKTGKSKDPMQFEKDERTVSEDRGKQERLDHERQQKEREEKEQRRREKEKEEKEREQQRLERERERARQAVERATREARERAAAEARQRAERAAVEKANAEARERAERAAVQRAQAEARERAAAEAKERAEKAAAEAKEREARGRAAAARAEAEAEARVKAERAAVERAAAEARERAAAEARERAAAAARMNQQQNENDLESFFSMGARASSAPRPPRPSSSDSVFDAQFQSDVTRKSTSVSSSMKKASSTTNIVDDLSSIFGAAPSSGEFQEVEGESEERRRARLDRHQRAQERAAKALAEKNQRDLQTQREQAERHRLAETLDFEIKRWAAGKEGNLRALLSTLQYVLWPECGWQPVSLTDLITAAAVKKAYRKATLCIHPDKVQQKGATLQQKYVAEKVFDLLKEAWNKFNSEELF
ncbi:auxilin-related protein 2-like isoform X2 [Abrus precatorius]|uniref:Auxilin-related protein 2-like isoform X2 n=1 Tax=Abrus precatorius TaxID=3816 RepID=A0A8B8MKK9_ABRPR|nr:auxilin-related protein 2-like isoform X2 [Abrus precatorius]XP_027367784.1 auxilin-related protein 2-like isoform X2 [Abrus precatorius]